jgi:hypothetical protein
MIKCNRCKTEKEEIHFTKKEKIMKSCLDCREKKATYRKQNKNKQNEYTKKWRDNNKDQTHEYNKFYKNKDDKSWDQIKTENNFSNKVEGQPSTNRKEHYETSGFPGILGKDCSNCKVWQPLTKFGKNSSRWDSLRLQCKPCINQTNKKKLK